MAKWKLDKFPRENTCNLTKNKNKSKDTHPDFRGNLHISKDSVKFLVECVKEGKEPILSLTGYDNGLVDRSREGRYGANIRLNVENYDESWMRDDPPRREQKSNDDIDLDDDIPF